MTTTNQCNLLKSILTSFLGKTAPPTPSSTRIISQTPLESNPFFNLNEFYKILMAQQDYPSIFIRKIISSKITVYMKLFHVEHFLDHSCFIDLFVNLNRDIIDSVVPYEYQNVRVYFYYLVLKARIKEHKQTHKFTALVDQKSHCFVFEKVLSEVLENTRFAGRLMTFFGFCHASNGVNMTEYIFMKRVQLFEDLFEENLCLLTFLLVHFEQLKGEVRIPVLNESLVSFRNLYAKYAEEIKAAKPNFDFEDRVKKLALDFLTPLFSFAQTVIFNNKKAEKKSNFEFQAIQLFIEKLKKIKPQRTVFLDQLSRDMALKIANTSVASKLDEAISTYAQSTDLSLQKRTSKKWKEDDELHKRQFTKIKAFFELRKKEEPDFLAPNRAEEKEERDSFLTEEYDFETILGEQSCDFKCASSRKI